MSTVQILCVQALILIVINLLWHACYRMKNAVRARSIQDVLLGVMFVLGLLGLSLESFVFRDQDSLHAFVFTINPAMLYLGNLVVIRARDGLYLFLVTYVFLLWQVVLIPLAYTMFQKEVLAYTVFALVVSVASSAFYIGTSKYEVPDVVS